MKNDETRTALITGASGGVGRAYAYYFASCGYDLILVSKDFEKTKNLADQIKNQFGRKVLVFTFDICQSSYLNTLFFEIDCQNIDVLVNNAVEEFLLERDQLSSLERKRMIEIQVNSTVSLSLHLLRIMIAENRGCIINVSGSPSKVLSPQSSFCQASCRMFICQFTEGLLSSLSGTGVYVQAVCPGSYKADLGAQDLKHNRAQEIVNKAMEDLEQGRCFSFPGSRKKFFAKNYQEHIVSHQNWMKIS